MTDRFEITMQKFEAVKAALPAVPFDFKTEDRKTVSERVNPLVQDLLQYMLDNYKEEVTPQEAWPLFNGTYKEHFANFGSKEEFEAFEPNLMPIIIMKVLVQVIRAPVSTTAVKAFDEFTNRYRNAIMNANGLVDSPVVGDR